MALWMRVALAVSRRHNSAAATSRLDRAAIEGGGIESGGACGHADEESGGEASQGGQLCLRASNGLQYGHRVTGSDETYLSRGSYAEGPCDNEPLRTLYLVCAAC